LQMTPTLRFGRIAGIPVGASWSAVLIALLIAWSLAGQLLPAQIPGLGPAAYWLAGVAGAGLFLGSLLAHELGHAVVARRAGLRVNGITLWLLGGVAQLEDEPASPGDELKVAIVGPAVSLALAAGFGVAAFGLGALGGPAIAVAVAVSLAVSNTVLALFNLLPAAPLDGGRVLRGLLWRRHGNRVRAAVTATRAGVWVGAGLVAYGLLGSLTGWGIGTLWTALVGWFLITAARQERDLALLQAQAGGLLARQVMTPAPVTAPAWFTLAGHGPAPAHRRRPLGRRGHRGRAVRRPDGPAPHRPRRRRGHPGLGPGRGRPRGAGGRPGRPAGQRPDGGRGRRRRPPARPDHRLRPGQGDPRPAAGRPGLSGTTTAHRWLPLPRCLTATRRRPPWRSSGWPRPGRPAGGGPGTTSPR
jgi:Zn-dependent protease